MAALGAIVVLFLITIGACSGQSRTLASNEKLTCLQDITRFSTGASPNHYYECTGSKDGRPKMVECPDGQFYQTKNQICVPRDQYAKPEAFDTQALGRNFQLGSFYDARTNMFFPESSLWTRGNINENLIKKKGENISVGYQSDQRTKDKTSHMGIEASLEIDFMSGMVHVEGAGRYLDDKVSSEYEVNVELSYEATKGTQEIEKYLAKDYGYECANEQYTHIVTEVTLGIGAYFVFQSIVTSSEEVTKVTKDLEFSINNLPSFSEGGGGKINMSESVQETLDSTKLRMFGDFSPEYPLPSTYDSAVEFYTLLPTMTNYDEETETWSGVTTVSVHLLPITDICGGTDRVLHEITATTMSLVTSMLDKLEQSFMEAGVLLGSSSAQKLKPLRVNLNLYRTALTTFELEKKRRLAEILPNIRGGHGMGEDALVALVTEYNLCQFEYETSRLFLDDRRWEVGSIESLVQMFTEESNIGLADYENANDVEFIFERDMVVVLDVNILTPASLTEGFLNGSVVDESGFWFKNPSNTEALEFKLGQYHDFALDNVDQEDKGYLLKISPYSDTTQYTMRAYYKGELISDQFDVPKGPTHAPTASQIGHASFTFKIEKQNEFTIGVRVFINDIIEHKVIEQDILFPMVAEVGEDIEVEVKKLEPYKEYSFSVKYLTEVGTSLPSPVSLEFNTAPLSPPTRFSTDNVNTSSITLTWGKPTIYAEGIFEGQISYKIIIHLETDDPDETETTTDLQYTFSNLSDATSCHFNVIAVYNGGSFENKESGPQNLDVFTSPLAPAMIEPTEIYEHSAVVTWDAPERLGTGVELLHYVLEYSIPGSEDAKQIVVQENRCELTDLAMDSVYRFRVKIVTTEGKSAFSNRMSLTTKFTQQTDITHFKEEVCLRIDKLIDNIRRETRFCASKNQTTDTGILNYDSIYTSANNVEGAVLDQTSGLFTAGWAGTYQVAYYMEMISIQDEENLQDHSVWVMVNGEKVAQSLMHSNYDREQSYGKDSGSRVILVNLEEGHTVALTHETVGYGALVKVNFCVSSVMLRTTDG